MQTSSSRSSAFRHGLSTSPGGSHRKLARLGLMVAANLPRFVHSRPTFAPLDAMKDASVFVNDEGGDSQQPGFWLYFGVAVALVALGGMFAGLTLGLMGQDEIYLQVIQQSGSPSEKRNATKVLRLLKRGKHWVLVTLLLSNVITNETLPIVLDRSLGGGWPAVMSSTVLIVIFGEIIPQSVCVRYGLAVGAWFSPFVIALMHLMYPVAYPTALLLDWILGEDHGTIYKKAGLKTLVTLHKTLGPHPSERLNEDEVTIISAVLDLKEKPVGAIMTPIKDVFTMSADKVLDELTMDEILSAGYSRIPIHVPGEPHNFIGMLLVKMLITYDPEDEKRVGEFPLATLPETAEDTSCLDIVNFFQEGKSHMVLVSERPGENHGALGVVTLEDVIEELIGEEIVDESDVFIDVHKAIRRLNPPPLALGLTRRQNFPHSVSRHADPAKTASATANATDCNDSTDLLCNEAPEIQAGRSATPVSSESSLAGRRRSASNRRFNGYGENVMTHLNLGPANLAGRPRETKSKTVKIKQTDQTRQSFDTGLGRVDGAADFNSHFGAEALHNVPEETINKESDGLQVPRNRGRKKARVGSLVERVDIVDGVCKTIIETTSDSDDEGSGESDSGGSTSSRRRITGGKPGGRADRNDADRSGEMSPLLWRGG